MALRVRLTPGDVELATRKARKGREGVKLGPFGIMVTRITWGRVTDAGAGRPGP